ncbi:hypothetical protein SPI_05796 [Niveomyces insectorum RCEF 264]|uniref:Uncharacterized protein n=1 Tax=Niveomyces insectorum RCEF 264 TaxID=1081102 RepID=A0A167SG71_9HYPO|nr:hypothetical protein SPI_05796 [Niveomyces insectorum RCEF 264]
MRLNCSVVPPDTPSNAGIAGAGVLLSFIITAGVALTISTALVVHDTWGRASSSSSSSSSRNSKFPSTADIQPPPAAIATVIGRKLLTSYSDQQILTGIGLQSVGLAQAAVLVPYHFFLIWLLGLLATAVHNAALLALVHDFGRDRVLRRLRQALMLVNLLLSCVYGVFVLRGLAARLPPTLPVLCAWTTAQAGARGTASTLTPPSAAAAAAVAAANPFQYVATLAVIVGNCAVFGLATWYLRGRAQRFYRVVQMAGLGLMSAVAVGVTVRAVLLSQAFGRPSVPLADTGERDWSFGQLLSLLLLLLPLVSMIEIARGEIQLAPPAQDAADTETLPLVDRTAMQAAKRSAFP